jgi:hypothetical protein
VARTGKRWREEPEVRLELRVPLSLREALRQEAGRRHQSLNAYVVGLLLDRGEPWRRVVLAESASPGRGPIWRWR